MVQRATLTYLSHRSELVAVFELDSRETIVGRGTIAIRDQPEYVKLVSDRKAFQMRQGDTLFIVIASDLAMCREYFCIHRAVTESGEPVYFLRDLNSRCGTYLNDTQITKMEHPKDGDYIRCSSRFLFNQAHRDESAMETDRVRLPGFSELSRPRGQPPL